MIMINDIQKLLDDYTRWLRDKTVLREVGTRPTCRTRRCRRCCSRPRCCPPPGSPGIHAYEGLQLFEVFE